jgi:hypothetical protein
MSKLAEIREIKLNFGKFLITNEDWLCPACAEWSNSVEWFRSVNPTYKECPNCKTKIEENEE